jgi:hypothetical protein
MADSTSNLEILITAVDEASAAFESVDEALNAVGLTMNETTGEIENATLTQQQSFDQLAEIVATDSEEIQQLMLDEGLSFEEASAVQQEANEAIATSSESTSESVAASAASTRSSMMAVGIAAGIAYAAVQSAVDSAVSSAMTWDETNAVIANNLKNIGSSIPLSQIDAYAQSIQNTTLFSQQQALSAEAIVTGYKNLAPQYQNITMLSADLATKIQQFTGAATADMPNAMKILTNALNDPVAGLSQLQRQAGVDIPAATVTMIKQLANAGDTAGADAVILQALNGQVGGLAQAAAGANGGALVELENHLSAMGTMIGNILIPDLDRMAVFLEPIIADIVAWAEAHPKLTEALIIAVVVFTALLAVLTALAIIVAAVVAVVGGGFAALAVVIVAAVAIMTAAVVTNWDKIVQWTKILQDNWNLAWQNMSDFLSTVWTNIENTVKSGINNVFSAINGMIKALDSIHISIPAIQIPGTKVGTPALDLGFDIPTIPMLAAGGIVYNPVLAMIGEQGPEAVVPLSSLGGGGIGGGSTIQVFIQGGNYLDSNGATMIGNALATQIVRQIRVSNYRS